MEFKRDDQNVSKVACDKLILKYSDFEVWLQLCKGHENCILVNSNTVLHFKETMQMSFDCDRNNIIYVCILIYFLCRSMV